MQIQSRSSRPHFPRPHSLRPCLAGVTAGSVLFLAAACLLAGAAPAGAAQPPVGLGTATPFAVVAGSTVTNTGPSVINGNVGVSPGTALTGMTGPPNGTVNGTQHSADAVAHHAQNDVTTAYNDAAGRTPIHSVSADLTGQTLAPGIYSGPTLGLTGTVTLDGEHNADAVFVFKSASTLITGSASHVALINGVNPCNVYWQVGSSTTLGTNSHFVGTVLALASITATTGAVITGRLLARTGGVTLDDNVINLPTCTTATPPTSSSSSSGAGGGSTTGSGGSTTGSGGGNTGGSGNHSSGAGAPGAPLRSRGSAGATSSNSDRESGSASPLRSGSSTSPANQPPVLARTGTDSQTLAAGGVLAVAVGVLIMFAARRRVVPARHRH